MAACKYWDCGWCYAPDDVETSSSSQSACLDPDYCPYLKSQMTHPTHADNDALFGKDLRVYDTEMTEIEKVKAEIKVLEKKLALLEEMEKYKSPVEEAYKRWSGEYPSSIDDIKWCAFQMGYHYSLEDAAIEAYNKRLKEPEENEWKPTPQTPEQVENGLKEAFRKAIKEGIIPEVKQPTDELIDKLVENPPEFLKFELGKSLTDLIFDWWADVFTTGCDWDAETCIDNLVDEISLWLPKYQSAAGSQSIGVEDMVSGFNDCLDKIKNKLR